MFGISVFYSDSISAFINSSPWKRILYFAGDPRSTPELVSSQ